MQTIEAYNDAMHQLRNAKGSAAAAAVASEASPPLHASPTNALLYHAAEQQQQQQQCVYHNELCLLINIQLLARPVRKI